MADTPRRAELAVAFVIREKLSWALPALRRLYSMAGTSFRLYFVDSRYPAAARPELDAFLSAQDNVVRIAAERFLYPNEALNLVLERAAEPYTLLLQNDVLIERGAPARLLRSAAALEADVVVPAILDNDNDARQPAPHRDSDDPVLFRATEEGIQGLPDPSPEWREGCRRIHYFENHCLLARTVALQAAAPFAPLSAVDHVEICVALWRQGGKAYADPKARVLFMDTPPLPLRPWEAPFFRFRWDPVRARLSHAYMRERWKVLNLFDKAPFVQRQHLALQPAALLDAYAPPFATDTWPEEFAA